MFFFSALRQYFALSGAQRKFISSGIYAGNRTPREILDFIRPLARFDENIDNTRSQLTKIGCAGLILLFIAAIVAGNEALTPNIASGLVIFTAVLFVGSFLLRWFLSSFDLHNNLRLFVVPVLNTISQDMPENARMIIKLDLRGKTLKSKMINEKHDNPGWFSYPKISTWTYKDYWFSCKAPMVDGSNLFINVEDTVRSRKKTCKSRSGKTKIKTKVKIKHKITAGLAMKTKVYDLSRTDKLQNTFDRVKTKDKPKRKAVTLTARAVSTDVEARLEPSICLDLIGKILMNAAPATAKGA
ncbi:MAG: hypothetical protein PHD82_10100 [Candidatus Riflebacteria bacterium]|jgi:hypothetical protein|nr:hypothetical protein [Candidatus Riflebacteria bacterium]